MKTGHTEHIIREAIDIKLHPDNIWKLLLQTLQE
jgi:hypothetical protein